MSALEFGPQLCGAQVSTRARAPANRVMCRSNAAIATTSQLGAAKGLSVCARLARLRAAQICARRNSAHVHGSLCARARKKFAREPSQPCPLLALPPLISMPLLPQLPARVATFATHPFALDADSQICVCLCKDANGQVQQTALHSRARAYTNELKWTSTGNVIPWQ